MSDRQRELDRLVTELAGNPDYASGRRSFPRTVTADDAMAITRGLHQQIEQGTAAREAVATREGLRLGCTRGCNTCCEELIMVHLPEALLVAEWLRLPENAAILAEFRQRYPAWRARVGDLPAEVEALSMRGDLLGLEKIFTTRASARNLCVFNVGGDCVVYETRPTVCRTANAVDDASKCGLYDVSQGRRQALAFVPLDQFVERSSLLVRSLHHAVAGRKAPRRPLCEWVYELTAR